ncbi:MAG: hypothetical protein VW802_04415 [Rhodospirillaceae bacterium]|jgi:hypothetical protein
MHFESDGRKSQGFAQTGQSRSQIGPQGAAKESRRQGEEKAGGPSRQMQNNAQQRPAKNLPEQSQKALEEIFQRLQLKQTAGL